MRYSIITINYNHAEGLRRTIKSVVNQTCKDYEYIVIDGGSTDGSVDVIKEYADRIDFWVSESDKGIYNAMNKGIAHAHGEYLNFMNSGDCFHGNDVLSQLTKVEEDIIFGDTKRMDKDQIVVVPQIESFYVFCLSIVCHQSTFYKRWIFDNRKYDEELKILSDWKFTIEALCLDRCSFKQTHVVIADFEGGAGTSSNIEASNRERHKILNNLFPPLVATDYERMMDWRSPIYFHMPELARYYRLHHLVAKCIGIALRIFRWIKRK